MAVRVHMAVRVQREVHLVLPAPTITTNVVVMKKSAITSPALRVPQAGARVVRRNPPKERAVHRNPPKARVVAHLKARAVAHLKARVVAHLKARAVAAGAV